MASLAKILNTVQENNCTYSLPNTKQCLFCSSKTIDFDVYEKTFSISDDEKNKTFTLPITRLAQVIDRRDEMLYQWRVKSIRPDVFVEFRYHEIYVCEHAFRQLLVCLGQPVWDDAPPKVRITNFDAIISITSEVHIQFSFNHGNLSAEKFMIFNSIYDTKSFVPLSALEAMFNQRWDILNDLEYRGYIPESSRLLLHDYWSNKEYAVGLKYFRLSDDRVIRIVDKKEMIPIMGMQKSDFIKVLEIYKSYREHVKRLMLRDLEHRLEEELNSNKTIVIQRSNFLIMNESNDVQLQIPLVALVELIRFGEEILMNLRTSKYDSEIVYWSNEYFHIKSKRYNGFRILSFATNKDDHRNISIRAPTFKELIRFLQDADSSEDENMEVEESFRDSVRLTNSKRVEYSEDGKTFTLIDEKHGKTITLPMSAREAIQSNKIQILSDLRKNFHERILKNKKINEYWRNECYTICTAIFPVRGSNLHVVQFTQSIRNDFDFVITEPTFLKLLGE